MSVTYYWYDRFCEEDPYPKEPSLPGLGDLVTMVKAQRTDVTDFENVQPPALAFVHSRHGEHKDWQGAAQGGRCIAFVGSSPASRVVSASPAVHYVWRTVGEVRRVLSLPGRRTAFEDWGGADVPDWSLLYQSVPDVIVAAYIWETARVAMGSEPSSGPVPENVQKILEDAQTLCESMASVRGLELAQGNRRQRFRSLLEHILKPAGSGDE